MKQAISPWKEKVVVITGASSGIAAATAIRLAREDLHVGLIARRQERLDQVAAQIQAVSGSAQIITADLTDEKECLIHL